MANQRSPKRNNMVGAYVTPALKSKAMKEAKARGMSVADYVRYLLENSNSKEAKKQDKGE